MAVSGEVVVVVVSCGPAYKTSGLGWQWTVSSAVEEEEFSFGLTRKPLFQGIGAC